MVTTAQSDVETIRSGLAALNRRDIDGMSWRHDSPPDVGLSRCGPSWTERSTRVTTGYAIGSPT